MSQEPAAEVLTLLVDTASLLHAQSQALLRAGYLLRYGDRKDLAEVTEFLTRHGGWLNSLAFQLDDLQSKIIKADLARALEEIL